MKLIFGLMAASALALSCVSLADCQELTFAALEPSKFWSSIANDDKQDNWHRGTAIYFLFARHIKSEMTLARLVETLDRPTWIDKMRIGTVGERTGPLPSRKGEQWLCISVFENDNPKNHNRESFGIYLSFATTESVEADAFCSVLQNGAGSKHAGAKLKACLLFPNWVEHCDRFSKVNSKVPGPTDTAP